MLSHVSLVFKVYVTCLETYVITFSFENGKGGRKERNGTNKKAACTHCNL